jgi:hypothetical protein
MLRKMVSGIAQRARGIIFIAVAIILYLLQCVFKILLAVKSVHKQQSSRRIKTTLPVKIFLLFRRG